MNIILRSRVEETVLTVTALLSNAEAMIAFGVADKAKYELQAGVHKAFLKFIEKGEFNEEQFYAAHSGWNLLLG